MAAPQISYEVFKKTGVWKYFLRSSDALSAKCTLCVNKVIKCGGGSTSGLRTHIRTQHAECLADIEKSAVPVEPGQGPSSQDASASKRRRPTSLDNYVLQKGSLQRTLARLTAKDELSFKTIAESTDIQMLLRSKFDNVPSSRATIVSMVSEYKDLVCDKIKVELSLRKEKQAKFCLTFDEWTSIRNKRYMNICLHDASPNGRIFYNLGLIRITNSMPAPRCLELIIDTLETYSLKMTDIVAFCTDGASLMQCVGKEAEVLHQLCFAHAIHLAVCDTFYPKGTTTATPETTTSDEDSDDSDWELTENPELSVSVSEVVNKVRSVVRLFRKSPVSNDKLQFFVKEAHKKELVLILDVKTRWDSLYRMLERFLKLHDCVEQALIALNKASVLSFTAEEVSVIQTICNMLKPVSAAITRMKRRDVTLVTAKQVTDFVSDKLEAMLDHDAPMMVSLVEDLFESWNSRIAERNTKTTDVLSFLLGIDQASLTTKDVKAFVVNLLKRTDFQLSSPRPSQSSKESSADKQLADDVIEVNEPDPDDYDAQLDAYISNKTKIEADSGAVEPPLERIISKELEAFKLRRKRGELLDLVTGWLLSIPPTSVESERSFSVSGRFCTNIRNRLSDHSLNCLCILKWYFNQDFLQIL